MQVKEKLKAAAAEDKKRRANYKAGRDLGLSGRELFTFNPELVGQDDEEADEDTYAVEKDPEVGSRLTIKKNMFWSVGEFLVSLGKRVV